MRFFLLFLCIASLCFAQRTLDLGTISRLGVAKTVPVYWEVKSENLRPLIDRALGMHGGLIRVSQENASVIMEFRQIAGDRVELVLLGTRPRRVLYSQTFENGRSGYLALQAADRAVEKTVGIPGFFTGKLAFVSDRTGSPELYISDLFFQNIRQITSDQALITSPRFSPDGRVINYTSFYRSGFPDVFRIDLATGRRTPIASFRGLNTGGAFSPAGDIIALTLSSSGNSEVYLADPTGTRLKRLTRTPSIEASPSFSPDGQQVVFTSDMAGRPQLYTMSVLGNGPMMRLPTNISSYCAEPAWNPRDPNEIAFTVASGGAFEIAVYDIAKKQSRIVSKGEGDAIEPSWMNDGRHIIYTARTGTTRRLVLLDTQTGKTTPLTGPKWGRAYGATFSR